MQKLEEKAKTTKEIAELWNRYCKEGFTEVPQQIMEQMEAIWVRLEDSTQDKKDTLKTLWSTLEDECKRIQDEIDRGCYSNPLDIIFEVHGTISKLFMELLK